MNWTREKLEQFKIEYMKATLTTKDVFKFEGHEFVVGYAKYLIQHLDNILE